MMHVRNDSIVVTYHLPVADPGGGGSGGSGTPFGREFKKKKKKRNRII